MQLACLAAFTLRQRDDSDIIVHEIALDSSSKAFRAELRVTRGFVESAIHQTYSLLPPTCALVLHIPLSQPSAITSLTHLGYCHMVSQIGDPLSRSHPIRLSDGLLYA